MPFFNACCFKYSTQFVIDVHFVFVSKFPKLLKEFTCSIILLSITILLLAASRPLNVTIFVFCTANTVKPFSVIIWFNLYVVVCKLSSVLGTATWSSASKSFKICWFIGSGLPFMSSVSYIVIISSKCVLTFRRLTSTIVDVPHR